MENWLKWVNFSLANLVEWSLLLHNFIRVKTELVKTELKFCGGSISDCRMSEVYDTENLQQCP